MEFKKVWMSPETGKRSQYGYRTVGGILGIVLLMTLLLFGGTFLSLSMGIEQKGFSLLLLLAVSGLGIGLAILMSRRSIQDATACGSWMLAACPIMGRVFLALP